MDREYYSRGERKSVEVLDDVVAIKVAPDDRGLAPDAESFGTEALAADVGIPRETLEAFQNANWLIVEPAPDVSRSLDAERALAGTEDVGLVVRRDNGTVGIATQRLNVQVADEFSEAQAEAILTDAGLRVLGRLRFAPNLFEVDAGPGEDSLAASLRLHDDPRFKFAEPAFTEHIPVRMTPTDPRFAEQWQWSNTGQNGGVTGADVSAEKAWEHTRGKGIRVAVIDNGFNAEHEDLKAGVAGVSGFFSDATDPATFTQGTAGMPDGDHGTFCAGMVGARHNNNVGGCGAAPESDLMLVACLGDQVGTQTTLARAVAYAADPSTAVVGADPADGADILVSSLGPNGADWDLTQTLDLALQFSAVNGRSGRGLAIFWAASNGRNVDVMKDEVVSHPDVIAVVRSTRKDLEDNAARGPEVELIAPGVDVFSTTGDGGYGKSTGTSFAAPCAAGCAALALSMNPRMSRDELRAIMHDSAGKIGGVVYDANGHNDDYGYGRVNADAAVQMAIASIEV
jgi:subtilisin family serine protease